VATLSIGIISATASARAPISIDVNPGAGKPVFNENQDSDGITPPEVTIDTPAGLKCVAAIICGDAS